KQESDERLGIFTVSSDGITGIMTEMRIRAKLSRSHVIWGVI
ncbi:23314_t:CDS:1, partial [Racocetra persica]